MALIILKCKTDSVSYTICWYWNCHGNYSYPSDLVPLVDFGSPILAIRCSCSRRLLDVSDVRRVWNQRLYSSICLMYYISRCSFNLEAWGLYVRLKLPAAYADFPNMVTITTYNGLLNRGRWYMLLFGL